jgi:hypothetical protein
MLEKTKKVSRNLCFYIEKGNFNIDGQVVLTSKLQAINLDNQMIDKNTKGFIPVNHNLNKAENVDYSMFTKIPGYYGIKFKTQIGKKDKGRILIPDEIKLAKEFEIPENEQGGILILGAVYYKLQSGEGIKIFYIDPNVEGRETEDIESKGTPIIEEWIPDKKLSFIEKLPGWYEAITGTKRDTTGGEKEVIISLEFLESFDLNK